MPWLFPLTVARTLAPSCLDPLPTPASSWGLCLSWVGRGHRWGREDSWFCKSISASYLGLLPKNSNYTPFPLSFQKWCVQIQANIHTNIYSSLAPASYTSGSMCQPHYSALCLFYGITDLGDNLNSIHKEPTSFFVLSSKWPYQFIQPLVNG